MSDPVLDEIYRSHPAKFSDDVLAAIDAMTSANGRYRIPAGSRVLDPFAGVGKIFGLADHRGWNAVGVEIEPEWAAADPRIICANSKSLPFPDRSFDAAVFSPVYGNRMSDNHNPRERCRKCGGTGWMLKDHPTLRGDIVCSRCEGRGFNVYKRNTYRHRLDRRDADGNQENLHPDNAGRMHFHQKKYRDLHEAVYEEVTRVVTDAIVINVSDFYGGRDETGAPKRHRVVDWHLSTLRSLGWITLCVERVATPRLGYGSNSDLRVEAERVAVLTR